MRLTDKIMSNGIYKDCVAHIKKCEETRVFCKHGEDHSIDVARIAYALNLEENLGLKKDIIYATALLHDLGRSEEYRSGTPHDVAGVATARVILRGCGAPEDEINLITAAIEAHRGHDKPGATTVIGGTAADQPQALAWVIKKADKLSRPCYDCEASADCKWPDDKKNHRLEY